MCSGATAKTADRDLRDHPLDGYSSSDGTGCPEPRDDLTTRLRPVSLHAVAPFSAHRLRDVEASFAVASPPRHLSPAGPQGDGSAETCKVQSMRFSGMPCPSGHAVPLRSARSRGEMFGRSLHAAAGGHSCFIS